LLSELGTPDLEGVPGRPLVCHQCGGPLKVVAYVTDELSITRILDHLGLSPRRLEKPPPTLEALRVAEHGEGWGLPAEWE
jgi:hypothetical protein